MKKLLVVAALGLAGCATEQPATQAQAQVLGEQCQTYGFKPGSTEFAACIFQLDQNRIAGNRQRRMAVAQAMSQTGASMQQSAAMNRPINCTSTGYGNTIRTNCY